MFNLVVLSGRLTSDAELKKTPNGVSVCSFTIANDFGYGENKKTSFINVVAWRNTAELISKHFGKGNMIGIEGFIQTRKYQDRDGNNRTAFEVVANNVQFIESKRPQNTNKGDSLIAIESDPLVELENNLKGFELLNDDGDLPF